MSLEATIPRCLGGGPAGRLSFMALQQRLGIWTVHSPLADLCLAPCTDADGVRSALGVRRSAFARGSAVTGENGVAGSAARQHDAASITSGAIVGRYAAQPTYAGRLRHGGRFLYSISRGSHRRLQAAPRADGGTADEPMA